MNDQAPITDLVLIGGGHSHLAVIKHFAMQPLPGVRLTVISRDIHTPYSGMMPGMIAGHYQHDDAHIDLRRLCEWANCRLFHSEVTDIDLEQQRVHCNNRLPIRFDWLSINSGSQPDLNSIDGARQIGMAVKPIGEFLRVWQALVDHLQQLPDPRGQCISIVGGGAASVEVALACRYQLQQQMGQRAGGIKMQLLCASSQLLPSHNTKVQNFMAAQLARRNIQLHTDCKVVAAKTVEPRSEKTPGPTIELSLQQGPALLTDQVIWAIHAGSPQWPGKTGLHCDPSGFIQVNAFLQSSSHPRVFAAGDIAHFSTQPLAKSGVYAVRAGQHLAANLHRAIRGVALRAYRPQRRFLSLMMTGSKRAIASRGPLSLSGAWVWRWKDYIDRRFMQRYNDLPAMHPAPLQSSHDSSQELSALHSPLMRCGGCGAKVGSSVLNRVMAQLQPLSNDDIELGIDTPDDAAVITPPIGKLWLQTVDYFRAFIDDPYLLGKIATNHCLSDIYAMGATPHSALAIVTVPHAREELVEDTLLQLMSGAVEALNEQNTALLGGHTSEGAELGFGLSVNGTIDAGDLLKKGGLVDGHCLILTRALGTGTLFAANMQGQAKGCWIEQALQQMLLNNRFGASIIHRHQASACTDITGFGLLGHLLEMLQAANIGARLQLDALPLLTGAVQSASAGWLSSLHPDNIHAQQALLNSDAFQHDPHYPLLFDPQTAGGLLAAIPAANAEQCLAQLRAGDCPQATIIGVIDQQQAKARVLLT